MSIKRNKTIKSNQIKYKRKKKKDSIQNVYVIKNKVK